MVRMAQLLDSDNIVRSVFGNTDVSQIVTSLPGSRPQLWIINREQDLALFVLTPLLILPLMFAAKARFSIEQIAFFVAAFGAMGHHLPGMMRAYGDRDLFRRFRVRLIAAPIVIMSAAVTSLIYDLNGFLLVLLVWGVWHGLMQIYRFLRIYDAKVGSVHPLTVRLDGLMCLSWFVTGVVWSPGRMAMLVDVWNKSTGGVLLPGALIPALQWACAALTAAITVSFVWHYGRMAACGQRPSLVKLLAMICSIGFWLYATIGIDSVVLGVALFEVFHDVQYLAIVWVFNRTGVDQGRDVGSFTRFLFRRSGLMVGLYIGMVFGYGYLYVFAHHMDHHRLWMVLSSGLAASTLFHFYLDGFIWKESQTSTGRNPDLAEQDQRIGSPTTARLMHTARWLLLVVPIVALGAAELRGRPDPLTPPDSDRAMLSTSWTAHAGRYGQMHGARLPLAYSANVARLFPNSWGALADHGAALYAAEQYEQAAQVLAKAHQMNPDSAPVGGRLGATLVHLGRDDEAERLLRSSLQIDPSLPDGYYGLALINLRRNRTDQARQLFAEALRMDWSYVNAYVGMGRLYYREDRFFEAAGHYRKALAADKASYDAHLSLGITLRKLLRLDEALLHLRMASSLKPQRADPRIEAGDLLLLLERYELAADQLERAAELQPDNAQTSFKLAMALASSGQSQRALRVYERAVDLDGQNPMVLIRAARFLATGPDRRVHDPKRALALAQRAHELTGGSDPAALDTLAAAYAADGQFDAAVAVAELALAAPGADRPLVEQRLKLYRNKKPFRRQRP